MSEKQTSLIAERDEATPYIPTICPDCGYFDCEGCREFRERDRSQQEHDELNGE